MSKASEIGRHAINDQHIALLRTLSRVLTWRITEIDKRLCALRIQIARLHRKEIDDAREESEPR